MNIRSEELSRVRHALDDLAWARTLCELGANDLALYQTYADRESELLNQLRACNQVDADD